MNNCLVFGEVLVVFSLLVVCKYFFGKEGVIAWVAVATVLANIITAKNADIFGLQTAIGTVMFASTFLATDILSECYTKEDAKKAVKIGLAADLLLIVSTQIALAYVPSAFDYADGAMQTLFSLNLRISLASAAMYFIANMADVWLFNRIKDRMEGRALWLRNNVSTVLCNGLENFGFIGLAFAGLYDFKTILIIAASTTPFLYIARHIGCAEEE